MASRSTVAVTDDADRLYELQRQTRTCQRRLSELHQLAAHDHSASDLDALPRGAGRWTLSGQEGRGDGGARRHHCRLRALDEKVEIQLQLLLQLQRQRPPVNAALLDDMYQQQKHIAEVRQSV